jgi:hypothetical protein
LIGLVIILDVISKGQPIQVCSTVIADFVDIIPYVTITQVHTAIEAGMVMWADCLLHEFGEVLDVNPFRLVAAAFAEWARDMASVSVALAVFSLAHGQISLAIAVRAWCEDLYFEHIYLLSVGFQINKKARLSSERRAWTGRAFWY